MLDTDVAIHLRDGGRDVRTRIETLSAPPALSIISLVELRGGTGSAEIKRPRLARLEILLRSVEVIGFDMTVVDAYASIITQSGFSRARILDRLIAATALVHDLTLITIDGAHFRDIPDLKLEVWPSPAQ